MDENKLLLGPIDTKDEILIVLHQLQVRNALRRAVEAIDLDIALAYLKKIRNELIIGSVDTPREVELLLDYFRKNGILQSPVDTDEEIQLFMKNLREEGFFVNSIRQANAFAARREALLKPKEIKKPKRPRPKPRPDDEYDFDEGSDRDPDKR